jgi:hypothetical protein
MKEQSKIVGIIDMRTLTISKNYDEIFDFINQFGDEMKESAFKAMHQSSKDVALYFTAYDKENPTEKVYILLIRVLSDEEEKGLILAYDTDINTVAYFLSSSSNLSFEEAKQGFNE